MAKGIERDLIINLSGPLCHSRASGKIINAKNFNFVFLALPLIDILNSREYLDHIASEDLPNPIKALPTPIQFLEYKALFFGLKISKIYMNYSHQNNPLVICHLLLFFKNWPLDVKFDYLVCFDSQLTIRSASSENCS